MDGKQARAKPKDASLRKLEDHEIFLEKNIAEIDKNLERQHQIIKNLQKTLLNLKQLREMTKGKKPK